MIYSCIIILFCNVVCNNAFMFAHVRKIYFANTKHINRKLNILLTYEANNTNVSGDFPSFYEFLRLRSGNNDINNNDDINDDDDDVDNDINNNDDVDTIKADFNKFKESLKDEITNTNDGESFANTLKSKNLKLLTSFSAIQWARLWVYEMVNIKEFFPNFMYQDMYKMCDFGSVNVSKRYFYIGYYLPNIDQTKGPYYIGAFEINPEQREFITRIIIQNPYYMVKNDYVKEYIIGFKKELQILCNEASVFFKYTNLKNTSFERYYYSWFYEE